MNQDLEHLRLLSIFHYVVAGIGALVFVLPSFPFGLRPRHALCPGNIRTWPSGESGRVATGWARIRWRRRGLHAHRLDDLVLCLFSGTLSRPPPTLYVLSGHGGHPVRHGSLRHRAGRVYDHRAGAAFGEGDVRASGRRTVGQSVAAADEGSYASPHASESRSRDRDRCPSRTGHNILGSSRTVRLYRSAGPIRRRFRDVRLARQDRATVEVPVKLYYPATGKGPFPVDRLLARAGWIARRLRVPWPALGQPRLRLGASPAQGERHAVWKDQAQTHGSDAERSRTSAMLNRPLTSASPSTNSSR